MPAEPPKTLPRPGGGAPDPPEDPPEPPKPARARCCCRSRPASWPKVGRAAMSIKVGRVGRVGMWSRWGAPIAHSRSWGGSHAKFATLGERRRLSLFFFRAGLTGVQSEERQYFSCVL